MNMNSKHNTRVVVETTKAYPVADAGQHDDKSPQEISSYLINSINNFHKKNSTSKAATLSWDQHSQRDNVIFHYFCLLEKEFFRMSKLNSQSDETFVLLIKICIKPSTRAATHAAQRDEGTNTSKSA